MPPSPTTVNFDYPRRITKNPTRMADMIRLYLQEIPALVQTMKQALADQQWATLKLATHSIVPTFATMGMSPEYEDAAKAIQALAVILVSNESGLGASEETLAILQTLFAKVEAGCALAARELEEKLGVGV